MREVTGMEFCEKRKWIMGRVKKEVWKKPAITAVQRRSPENQRRFSALQQGPAVALSSWKLDLLILCMSFSPRHKRKEQMATCSFQNVCIYLHNTQSQGINRYFRYFLSASLLLLFDLPCTPQNLSLFTPVIISFDYSPASFFFKVHLFQTY